jgi:hypothetical protein
MKREIIGFAVLAVILVSIFWWPHSNWRLWQGKFLTVQGAGARVFSGRSRQAAAHRDSAELNRLYRTLREGEIRDRLDRLSDSLAVLVLELEEQRPALEAARERARSGYGADAESYRSAYFRTARAFSELEEATAVAEAGIDSLRVGIPAEGKIREDGGGDRVEVEAAGAGTIRWLTPVRVPVREACLSCHQPEGDEGRVMLLPGREGREYPEPMLQHPVKEYGCTICHQGAAASLEMAAAHGADKDSRPFMPGKLALRACGLCHARGTPAESASVPFQWPESCRSCHGRQALASIAADSLFPPFRNAPREEPELRVWLIRHWAEKTGRIPDREEFERAVTMIVSGDGRGAKNGSKDPAAAPGQTARDRKAIFTCPSCGRKFAVNGSLPQYYCPVDGALLETLRSE